MVKGDWNGMSRGAYTESLALKDRKDYQYSKHLKDC